MRNKVITAILLGGFVLCIAQWCPAGSIWAKRSTKMEDLYADDVAHGVGDVLTIKISEDSKVDNKAKRDLKKQTDRSTSFNGNLGIDHILPSIPGFTMEAESSSELKGKADYKDERSFVDSITVVVQDVMPNGNLVVMGTRDRNIAGDIQIIEVSGIVRPRDIEFDNTVKSERVAEFNIVTKHKGIAAAYNKPNWLGRIFDLFSPF